ncbi:hypothetical protein WR164_14120 [Philodulcilactobacillus myokoensis]|uniref:Uncharacterized protein n=1 Tax=Philodulcilactobacillus myokoensis TaxID=2929573 RepID=A0A9W6B2I1_9LACO|nr:hypothetical protein [Philodulcilactobacillus myokoensis]GLB47433.1 hypothetical protein WR164_14120 [Philodulcilactobacillus myokoensis]
MFDFTERLLEPILLMMSEIKIDTGDYRPVLNWNSAPVKEEQVAPEDDRNEITGSKGNYLGGLGSQLSKVGGTVAEWIKDMFDTAMVESANLAAALYLGETFRPRPNAI